MKNIPERIYLQVSDDESIPVNDFNELQGVTWSTDRINENDIEYHLSKDFNYCPKCGVKWEHDSNAIGCWKCGFINYPLG